MYDLERAFKTHNLEVTKEDLRAVFHNVNNSKTGRIRFSEFLAATLHNKCILSDKKIICCFRLLDKDLDGHLGSKVLKRIFSGNTVENRDVWDVYLRQGDFDGDQIILLEDFFSHLKQLL